MPLSPHGYDYYQAMIWGYDWTYVAGPITLYAPTSTIGYLAPSYVPDAPYVTTFLAFSASQIAMTNSIAAEVAGFTALTFATSNVQNPARATIQLSNANLSPGVAGEAYAPPDPLDPVRTGNLYIDSDDPAYRNLTDTDDEGAHVLRHEFGHSLGLKHPFDAPDPGTGGTQVLTDENIVYSVMAYNGSLYRGEYLNPDTYMVFDIATLQSIYGANFATRNGATVYRFEEAATGDPFRPEGYRFLIDGVQITTADIPVRTIWDGGGTDEYDFSALTHRVQIDLRPGSYTNFLEQAPPDGLPGTLGTAFLYSNDARSYIENARGGSANDEIIGNDVDNVLLGNGGNDVVTGGLGNDTLTGGAGIDQLDGGAGNDVLNYDVADTVVLGGAGTDRAVFQGATVGLRNYDFTGHQVEILDWTTNGNLYRLTPGAGGTRVETVTDTANSEAGFAARTTTLDALIREELVDSTRDDGMRQVYDYDPANAAAWSLILDTYAVGGALDYQDTRFDNLSRVIFDADQANSGNWFSITTTYDAAVAVDYQDTRYDDLARVIFDGDQANAFTWLAITTTYTPAATVDYQDYRYDDLRRVIFDSDQASAFTWSAVATSYDALARLDVQDTTYDDNRRVVFDWDNNSAFTWLTYQTEFNAAGVITRQVITYDDGTVVII